MIDLDLGLQSRLIGSLPPWPRGKMVDISKTTFPNAFSSLKICAFRLKFDWNLFPRVPADYLKSGLDNGLVLLMHHYLNQCWQVHRRICVTRLNELTSCPACRTTLVATRFRVAVICPIIQVPHCIRVFFYFVWFVFINHIFQFYYELCTYCNILDIYLS